MAGVKLQIYNQRNEAKRRTCYGLEATNKNRKYVHTYTYTRTRMSVLRMNRVGSFYCICITNIYYISMPKNLHTLENKKKKHTHTKH